MLFLKINQLLSGICVSLHSVCCCSATCCGLRAQTCGDSRLPRWQAHQGDWWFLRTRRKKHVSFQKNAQVAFKERSVHFATLRWL